MQNWKDSQSLKYLLVVSVCVGVFVISQIIPQSGDERFYLINSSWSLLVIFLVTRIQRTKTIFAICVIESIMTIVNLITCIDYLNGKGSPYAFYPTIINSLNAIEAVVLIIGAPWIGAYNRLSAAISDFALIYKHYIKLIPGISIFKSLVKKSKKSNKRFKK